MKRRHWINRIGFASLSLAVCSLSGLAGTAHAADADSAAKKVVRLGTMSGPDADIWQVARGEAAKHGLTVKITEFNDYVQPNAALDAGDLDANAFQHKPYLDSQIQQRGYKIVSVGLTYIAPLSIYSHKIKKLSELTNGASIGIPNDPSNENRALLLLQSQHLITLRPGAGVNGNNATVLDVASNPKKLKLQEMDAAQLPRALGDLTAAAVNNNFAIDAGLDTTSALAREGSDSPYANLIAVRTQDQHAPWVKTLVAAYQSAAVSAYIKSHYHGAILPAF
ncbi:MetQ/NlpA family ABC transporter substrate-binding protein [Robbsia sp. KACC 23696]|uniref:MetQ/NlpA family ABC transporter substrate-binding protein n=1 Tax=Robbsia sp. KACC 23696 TaxID=3149231 RepID=UPI00325A8286